uniref:Metadherin n=1 Tax=Oryzias latipes TaxID=8090 RepID=H2LCM4_ORYLA
MEQWKDAASQQVKLLARRLNEELSKGLGWLRSELGVDLGLKPELIPPWAIVLAACAGLLLMVALWASVCRAVFKKRPAVRPADDGAGIKQSVSKPVKSDEPKKKKKKAEKKAQPNGRAVPEPQEEEAIASEEIVPHHHQPPPPQGKSEKTAEGKKSKKKPKQAAKETKIVTADGKEPEEGTWETKVSNKEKREQRKKDKSSSDGSSSPGGGNTPVSVPPEQPKTTSAGIPAPTNQKKKQGKSARVKPEKVEAAVTPANSSEVVDAAAAKGTLKVRGPSHNVPSKQASWTASIQPAPLWRSGIDDSWTVIDRPIQSAELNLVSLARLGVGPAQPQSVSSLSWVSQPRVEDEWSGINGASSDPSSDWNAPSEAWGNYEEPTTETPLAQEKPLPESSKFIQIGAAEEDEDEKDKGDGSNDGAAKTKKKKKKKKKAAEEGGTSVQVEEPVKESTPAVSMKKQPSVKETAAAVPPVKAAAAETRGERSVKDAPPPITQVPQKSTEGEPTAKQNNLPTPTLQKKPEESQAPKPAKKKKARRET